MSVRTRQLASAAAALILCTIPAGALAQRPSDPPAAAAPAADQEARDAAVVRAAMAALARSGYAGLREHLPALNEVAAHAPASYPMIERRQGVVIYRGDGNPADDLRAALLAAFDPLKQGDQKLEVSFNTYGLAFLMRGSYAVEMQAPGTALQVLEKGVAMQPDNIALISEMGQALGMLSRFEDMRAAYSRGLEIRNEWVTDLDRARLLRGRGFALIELNRLDEAEQDFHASLELEPGNPRARDELTYIARLRAGGRTVPPEISAPGIPGSVPQIVPRLPTS